MAFLVRESLESVRELWFTISGWHDIKSFARTYFRILRNPIRNTIGVYNTIDQKGAFQFFVQSFVIFTIITSLFTAFKGNDILKSIMLMINQMVFLTLTVFLYFIIFRKISKTNNTFSNFLTMYTLYMGFALPIFAFGSYLNWQVILMTFDPAYRLHAPSPSRVFGLVIADLTVIGFAMYYTAKINHYFWEVSYGRIVLVFLAVFVLLTPFQRAWLMMQCKMGIVPEFEFNNLAHRKATYEILGCDDAECNKCLVSGNWRFSDNTVDVTRKYLESVFAPYDTIAKRLATKKSARLAFDEDKWFTYTEMNEGLINLQYRTSWFLSDDGKNIYFDNNLFEVLALNQDSMWLRYGRTNPPGNLIYYDTLTIVPASNR